MACVEGLGKEWESSRELRTRILEKKLLTERPEGHKWCEPNRPNCVANTSVLMPILRKMRDDDSMKLPVLEDLKKQIGIVYHRLAIQIKEEGDLHHRSRSEEVVFFREKKGQPT